MRKSVLIEVGNIDENGDMVLPDGIVYKNPVLITRGFRNDQPLGFANLYSENGKLYGDLEVKENASGLFPGIAFQIIESETKGNVRVVKKCKLICVGLSDNPNSDRSIPPISEN